jgi:polysaccharide biosynthesis/export protein
MRMRFRLSPSAVTMIAILSLIVNPISLAMGQSKTAAPANSSKLTDDRKQPSALPTEPADDYFRNIYRDFYDSYKLGPEDQLALRIKGQPDYSLEQVTVSPVGKIYHPLLGDLDVAGLTVPKLTEKLTIDLSQYIIDPKVSLSLLTANSAKIGVLGMVEHPGVLVMSRPLTVLDAITMAGGVNDSGSKSDVTILRQNRGGNPVTMKVNVKKIMEAKSDPEANMMLQAGDTLIVHSNTRKKISNITSMLGFTSFLWFIRGY